ncbi:MAG: metal ABC transporter permease [Defluviitaleaceae bacterium]|nr:metal ABC transporter permease [Defluviitaleaceae bacterium]
MIAIIDKLVEFFQYEFVQYAMLVGVLISLSSALLGVTLVLKRFSFIGDGLSHVAFGTMAIAGALGLVANLILVLPVTIVCSIFLMKTGQNAKIKGDAALAMLSVGSLGIGYLVMNMFSKSSNLSGDVCATLFGSRSILTLSHSDIWLCIILSVLVASMFILFYHKIFSVTFDEDFTTAIGVRAKTYNLIFAIVIAIVIVLAMRLVGALLVSALVIFPALSAMRVFKSFFSVTVCSVMLAVVCTSLGILASIVAETPVGATIVAVDVACFVVFSLTGFVLRRG